MGIFSKKKEDKEKEGIEAQIGTRNVPKLPEMPPEGIEYKNFCGVKDCGQEMRIVCSVCAKKLCDTHKYPGKHECSVNIETKSKNNNLS